MDESRLTKNVPSTRQRDLRLRIGLWAMIAVLSAIAIESMNTQRMVRPRLNLLLALVAGVIVIGVVSIAYVLAFQHGLEKLKHEMSFVLTDRALIRKWKGHSNVQIGLADISAVYLQGSRLVVESSTLGRQIAIPQEIEGF